MKKITRNEINKNDMVALYYCQCQHIIKLFADDYKIGYNSGANGWNYDLYNINGVSVVTGYNVPYEQYNNKARKNALVKFNNKVANLTMIEVAKNYQNLKKEFSKIFE